MTINWRKTAGGVEIAEHEDMTCIVWGHGGVVVARNGDNSAQERYCNGLDAAKEWFEHTCCQPKYTVTKYGDGGEVYASNDGKRVAMASVRPCGRSESLCGDGDGRLLYEAEKARQHAINYVTGKDL